MKKITIISICICLSITAWARIGMTTKECEKKYGKPVKEGFYGTPPKLGNYAGVAQKLYKLNSNDRDEYEIYLHICFINDKAELIAYCKYKKYSRDKKDNATLFEFPCSSSRENGFSHEETKQIKKANNFDPDIVVYYDPQKQKVAGYRYYELDDVISSCFLKVSYCYYKGYAVTKKGNTVIFYCFANSGVSILFTDRIVKFVNKVRLQEYREKAKKEKSKVDEINF